LACPHASVSSKIDANDNIKSLRAELHEHLRALFDAPDLPTARILLQALLDAYASRAPNAMASQAIDISVLVCFNNNHDRSHQ
jgi:hypothetical protein